MPEEKKPVLNVSVPATSPKRTRISEAADYAPWVRADAKRLPDCQLYWLPVSAFPLRHDEKLWIHEFLDRFTGELTEAHGLRCENFLRYKQLSGPLIDIYKRYAFSAPKMIGLGRSANTPLPSFPSPEQVKAYMDAGTEFDYRDWVGDYLLWFAGTDKAEQRQLFFGHGATCILALPPDPHIKVPHLPFTPALRASMPVFQKMNVDAMIGGAFAMLDQFLEKSKVMFGEDLKDTVEYMGTAFIIPLLSSVEFFAANQDLRSRWFELFEVYLNESVTDKGVLLAFQNAGYEESMLAVLDAMKLEGMRYAAVAS